jgi:DNA-binding transcriptional regulator YdaS (Cro superfamily)
MHNTGQPITFVTVARNAGVSTSFLYQNSQIRDDITARRTATTATATKSAASSASLQSLRTKLATTTARNRELTEQIAQLRIENETLRSRLLGH